ncbi:hypothetical protein [Kribbella sp. NPDC006257]|uniref:TPR repeat region-containing protein n=1 Tax=Kribbella sp. NPDC006257 TaxID=3156738 RepID=UPI00339FA3DD
MARKDEGGHGSGGDGFCMIDPVVLGGVINDLATMETAIGTELKGLRTEFEKVGVSTQPLTDLTNVAHWLHGELPMLRRRHAAALLLESQGMWFQPGTHMLVMPEDPELATKQAGELAAKRIRDGLDAKPPNRLAITDAAKALQKITGRKGQLSPDDLTFLQAVYGGLGRAVYRIPDQLGDDKKAKSAFVDALLLLSNSKLGGGFGKVPAEIRQDLRDTGWQYWNGPGDKATNPLHGDGFPALAKFLLNRDPDSKVDPGDEFATDLGRSAVDNLRLQQWLQKEYGRWQDLKVAPPDQMAKTALLGAGEVQGLLGLVALSHKASATLMSDTESVRALIGHDWEDKGKAVAGLTDWAAKVALDPDSPEYVMAKQATASLIDAVTVNDSDENSPQHDMFKDSVDWMKKNPEIAKSFGKLIAANITDFGDDEPTGAVGPGDERHLRISTDQRHRFAMLASTDQESRIMLRVASDAYKAEALEHPGSAEARSAGFIDAMVTAASHNAIYYDHIDDADAKNAAAAASRADDEQVRTVANYVFGELISAIHLPAHESHPGGPEPLPGNPDHLVGAGKFILSKILTEGLIPPPDEPKPVLPTVVDTDSTATGVGVPENRAAYDLANAQVRGGHQTGLPPGLVTNGPDGKPHLKDPSTMTSEDRRNLNLWADRTGHSAYVDTYASAFRGYYGLGEKIEDGPDGLRNFVDAPTK